VGPGKEEIEVVESKLRGLGVALVSVALLMGFSHAAGASTSSSSSTPTANLDTLRAALLAHVSHETSPAPASAESSKIEKIVSAEGATSTSGTFHAESIPSAVCKTNTYPDSGTDATQLNIVSTAFAYDCGNDVAAISVHTSDSWADSALTGGYIAFLDTDGNPNDGCAGDDYALIAGWDAPSSSIKVTLAKTVDCVNTLYDVGPSAITRLTSNDIAMGFKLGSVGYPKSLNWDVAIGTANSDPDWAPELPDEFTFIRPTGNQYFLKNSFAGGAADIYFAFGNPDDTVLIGDWDGDGIDTIAVRRGNTYYITNSLTGGVATTVFSYGNPGDTVLIGDWDGDGKDTIAVRRGNTYYMTNTLTGGVATTVFSYGNPGDTVLVGDWNNDHVDTLAVRRGNTYYMTNTLTGGPATTVFSYGNPSDVVLVGDWDGDGVDTLAVRRGNTYYLTNVLTGGPASTVFSYGNPDDVVLVGDWDGNGTDTFGLRR
jgi:hypothetical protein